MSTEDLTAVLTSRICHDLVSPIGAIVNGVDLIREIGGGDIEAELGMINQSSARASALLQFYRVAFGAAASGSDIARGALRDQSRALIETPRIIIDWPEDGGPHVARPHARLLFQVLLCARALTGMRGIIAVRMPLDGFLPLSVNVQTAGGADCDEMLGHLCGTAESAELSPRLIEFVLVRQTASDLGMTLDVQRTDDAIRIDVA
ncbi:MAG: histidine phosphotransferase family protein [Pseudomonadota bacterium]